jgi:hypothetical protein
LHRPQFLVSYWISCLLWWWWWWWGPRDRNCRDGRRVWEVTSSTCCSCWRCKSQTNGDSYKIGCRCIVQSSNYLSFTISINNMNWIYWLSFFLYLFIVLFWYTNIARLYWMHLITVHLAFLQ